MSPSDGVGGGQGGGDQSNSSVRLERVETVLGSHCCADEPR